MKVLQFFSTPALAAVSCLIFTAGCERKEKVLDIKTPDGGIEVERDKRTGEVEVKVD